MLERLRSLRERLRGTSPVQSQAAPGVTVRITPPAPGSEAGIRTDPRCLPADLESVRAAIRPRGRPLIVNHWATWCPPCVEELPRLVAAAGRLAGHADFVGVSWDTFQNPGPSDEVAREVAAFAGDHGLPYESVVFTGEPEELFTALELSWRFIPQTFVLDARGRVLVHFQGELSAQDVDALVDRVEEALRQVAADPPSN